MCDKCFDKEYNSFPTYKDFDELDLLLTKKLSAGQLKSIGDNGKYLDYSFSIYKCESCQTIWWLSMPENAWRGFFAHDQNAKLLLDKIYASDKKKGRLGLVIVGLITVIIIFSVFKTCA